MSELVKIHYRACHLCEAICGLEIKTQGSEILSIKGDKDDPFSRGHICPKAVALKDLHEDPNRLKKPIKKQGDSWVEVSWEDAFKGIATRISEIQGNNGNDSVAVYAGNPNVHNYGNLTHGRVLRKALGSRSNFSATSLDQLPHHFAALHLYGHQFLVPVPDIDRTQYMLILGGNPIASNGSMMTVPDVGKRLKAIQKRGGKFVVIDPRKTETADIADQHLFIKPNTDVYFLLAFLNHIIENKNSLCGDLSELVDGIDEVASLVKAFDAKLAAEKTGMAEQDILEVFESFLNAKSAVCYGRMGVSVQTNGTICQWAIQLINILSGNLDREGGAMFPSSAVGYVKPGEAGAGSYGRFKTRVRGLPEFGGELPSTALAEEMLTPGDGQIKALITLAGNPVLSSPNGRQLDQALEGLEFMVAVDIYLNETTRHADYILPSTGPLEHDHYDLAFYRLAVRDVARFNEPIFEPKAGTLHDWQILLGLAEALSIEKNLPFKPLVSPDMLIDFGLQAGPYSKSAGSQFELTLDKLKQHPHGIDLGPLKSSLKQRLCTEDERINLFSPVVAEAVKSLTATNGETGSSEYSFMLIGRRHVRSNNSWMHNYHRLVKGKPRHFALANPLDVKALGVESGSKVRISTRVGSEELELVASEEMMQGVVSIPHGWGHNRKGTQIDIASAHAGISVNDLSDDALFDPVTGNAALNGVPCAISAI